MKYRVVGQAKYEYMIEAEDEDEAVEKALELFHETTFQTWDDVLEWDAEEIKQQAEPN